VVLACTVLLLSYQFLVRYTPIGTLLNGTRHRPPGARPWWSRVGRRVTTSAGR
jgi:hypothetical protein